MTVTAEEFVRIWQAAKTVGEVASRTGMKTTSAYSKAYAFRKEGVPLKTFRRKGPIDFVALRALAESLTTNSEHGP